MSPCEFQIYKGEDIVPSVYIYSKGVSDVNIVYGCIDKLSYTANNLDRYVDDPHVFACILMLQLLTVTGEESLSNAVKKAGIEFTNELDVREVKGIYKIRLMPEGIRYSYVDLT